MVLWVDSLCTKKVCGALVQRRTHNVCIDQAQQIYLGVSCWSAGLRCKAHETSALKLCYHWLAGLRCKAHETSALKHLSILKLCHHCFKWLLCDSYWIDTTFKCLFAIIVLFMAPFTLFWPAGRRGVTKILVLCELLSLFKCFLQLPCSYFLYPY